MKDPLELLELKVGALYALADGWETYCLHSAGPGFADAKHRLYPMLFLRRLPVETKVAAFNPLWDRQNHYRRYEFLVGEKLFECTVKYPPNTFSQFVFMKYETWCKLNDFVSQIEADVKEKKWQK